MPAINDISLALLTTRRIDTIAEVTEILRRLCAHPQLAPRKWGVYEPQTSFDLDEIDKIAAKAVEMTAPQFRFYWSRTNPRAEGAICGGTGKRHATIDMNARYLPESLAADLVDYLRSESLRLTADIGFVECDWPGQTGTSSDFYDRRSPSISQEAFDQMARGYYTIQLKDYLVQLKWATVFGPPYVQMFGRETLLSAPAAIVEEIGPEMIYVQLTPKMEDIAADLSAFFAIRGRVKEHIGPDAFFDPVKGNGPYRKPSFDLEPWGRPQFLGFVGGNPVIGLLAGKPIVQTDEGPRVLDMPWTPPGS